MGKIQCSTVSHNTKHNHNTQNNQHEQPPVSSHNICTVAPCYRELLALLVIPTWLLHRFPRFERALVPHSLAWNLPLLAKYLRYVAAPLLVPTRGSSLDGCLTGLVTLASTHMYGYLLYMHTCDRECEQS
jgi:hypothetical protein